MDFYVLVDEVVDLVRRRGRVSYQALKAQFDLDDERLRALKEEVLYAHQGSVEQKRRGLVWIASTGSVPGVGQSRGSLVEGEPLEGPSGWWPDAERRQLTVLFCDLVGSTTLSSQLDPEDWREVVHAYQESCTKVIARYGGQIGQYLGDGVLVYFGYPRAHEDDAQRAVRAGLGIIEAVKQLNAGLTEKYGLSVAVRLGCHTGLVVVGRDQSSIYHDRLAVGEAPNIAARLESIADPNSLVIGALTHQLLGGLFACKSLGTPPLKGVAQPLEVYQVLYESTARTRLEALGPTKLTPLVGRDEEVALLRKLWTHTIDGRGQAVLLHGEPGIGKSRLVQALSGHAAQGQAWLIPCQCSPHYQHTALYPVIDLLERVVLRFEQQESPEQKLRKLEGLLVEIGLPLTEVVPLFASLLSIPLTPDYPAADISPEQQKQQTMTAISTVLLRRAAQQPVLFVVEDLQWVDPTTLELLSALIEHLSDARIMALFTFRPDFHPRWEQSAHITHLSLTRLPADQAAELSSRVAGKTLPAPVMAQVLTKTDGVPLFVEELTKMLLESGLLEKRTQRYELAEPLPPLAIPNTLHDSLMARLDRLSPVKSLAQLAATLGRDFSYELLRAVTPTDDDTLRRGLRQLVKAELLYQQGRPPRATYRFKHALIQDAAYQSLLKGTRQQHHHRIAQAIESGSPDTVSTQPELLAHHYTQAGLPAQAIPYWEAAGRRALQRSANRDAASHATQGLNILKLLPDTEDRATQELSLQIIKGVALGAVHGPQAPETVYARACELARRVGSTPELFPALSGFAYAQMVHGRMREARALAEEFLELAQSQDDPLVLSVGHRMVAYTAWFQGDVVDVRNHTRKGLTFYNPDQHRLSVLSYSQDSGVVCGYLGSVASWVLGYPEQSARTMEQTVAHARGLEHPYSVAMSLLFSAQLSQLRGEPDSARANAEEALAVTTEHGLDAAGAWCLLPLGWAEAQQGDVSRGISDICRGMEARRAGRVGAVWPWFFALLGEAYGIAGQLEDGLRALDEALWRVKKNDEHLYEAEAYRLKGELLVGKCGPDATQAEACYRKALAVAGHQQAKSWELRAAMSMSRLWMEQGKRRKARELLLPIYDWFTEGFDTADLQQAAALVGELS